MNMVPKIWAKMLLTNHIRGFSNQLYPYELACFLASRYRFMNESQESRMN